MMNHPSFSTTRCFLWSGSTLLRAPRWMAATPLNSRSLNRCRWVLRLKSLLVSGHVRYVSRWGARRNYPSRQLSEHIEHGGCHYFLYGQWKWSNQRINHPGAAFMSTLLAPSFFCSLNDTNHHHSIELVTRWRIWGPPSSPQMQLHHVYFFIRMFTSRLRSPSFTIYLYLAIQEENGVANSLRIVQSQLIQYAASLQTQPTRFHNTIGKRLYPNKWHVFRDTSINGMEWWMREWFRRAYSIELGTRQIKGRGWGPTIW
jgi:hypothetical protein